MKAVKIAYFLLCFSFLAVLLNSCVLNSLIADTVKRVEVANENDCSKALLEYEDIFEEFKKRELYIGLTVNHEDLSDVEIAFAEIIGAARAGDLASLLTAKSRLIESLRHLKRLSGINIESIL